MEATMNGGGRWVGRQSAGVAAGAWMLVLVVAACGGGQASPRAAASNPVREAVLYAGPDREQKLAAAAANEGALTWYTSHSEQTAAKVMRAFEGKYPGLKTSLYRSDGTDFIVKLTEENRAGKSTADVIETILPTTWVIQEAGLLTDYYLPNADAFPPAAKSVSSGKNVYWAVDREHYISFGYNSDILPASAVPRDWNGLLTPELKGRMALPGSATGVNFVGYAEAFLGSDYFSKLAQQNVKLMMVSGAAMGDLVARGEVVASPGLFYAEVLRTRQDGAHVEWVPIPPVTANAGAVGISKSAPHPNAAALFASFLLGEEGHRLLADAHFGFADVDPGFQRWYPGEGMTGAQYEEVYDRWRKVMTETLVR
jgi:iron(III) transport system substrate-binding protein